MNSECPRVALLVETSRGYGRGMLQGIVRYSRLHGPWSFHVTPGDFEQTVPEMQAWEGDGIIARVETPAVAQAIVDANLPTVLLEPDSWIIKEVPELSEFSVVSADSEGAAKWAAKHLMERGFQSFAYVGLWNRDWSQRRNDAYQRALQDVDYEPRIYPFPENESDRSWEREQSILSRWIAELPKPVGVMACNDDRGREVLDACRLAGVSVPEDVAVIGVDNDDLFCELSDPPLSSVALNSVPGGYRVAELLDQMMKGDVKARQRLAVEPVEVVTRRSTEVTPSNGQEISAALGFIHRNRAKSFSVEDIAESIGIPRRDLEAKFRKQTGRTIVAEIRQIRLNHAKQMLRETDVPIPQVAESSGYSSVSYLTQVFRKELDVTPAKYRIRYRI